MAVTVDQVEAYALLRDLAERCPRPQRWHAGAEHVAELFADLETAVEVVGSDAAAAAAFAAELDGAEGAPPAADEWPLLAAAQARLASLPSPDGQHPFLDVIRPTLDALGTALAALARVATAAAAFELQRPHVHVELENAPRPDLAPWAASH
jgi:hypothetical protein